MRPVSVSIRTSRWVVSWRLGWRSVRTSSVTVASVCSPGSRPLIASMLISLMPSGRVKSRMGNSLRAATSSM